MWYKITKSTIGAVFNIRRSLAETIVGVPPIEVTNKVNTVKHLLKLNIIDNIVNDPYKLFLKDILQQRSYGIVVTKVKEALNFLKWKINYCSSTIDDDYKNFISGRS